MLYPIYMNELVIDYHCPLLDIGQQKGNWGYINFIEEYQLGPSAVVKGADCIGRSFLALKAEFVLENGDRVPTFSTFYQKYVNNKNIWQCYNYIGKELLWTSYIGDGYPIDKEQTALLKELLTYQRIELTAKDVTHFMHSMLSTAVALQLRV